MPRKKSARIASAGLSKTIDHNLRVYSAAALAAGVSVLALGLPAGGEVVVTKKTIPLPYNTFPIVGIDFNHDGINDFSANLNFSAYPLSDWDLFVFPVQSSGGVVASHKGYASALVRGAKIGPANHFITGPGNRIEHVHTLISNSQYVDRSLRGNWSGNPKNRYLGVKFLIKGKIHYGWIRLTVITQPLPGMTATITGYAYETVANKAITAGSGETAGAESEVGSPAPKPAARSLGMLAAGMDGLAIWRRE